MTSTDEITRRQAAELAQLMTAWLTNPRTADGMADPDLVPAQIVEWCRSARDVLAVVGGAGEAPRYTPEPFDLMAALARVHGSHG